MPVRFAARHASGPVKAPSLPPRGTGGALSGVGTTRHEAGHSPRLRMSGAIISILHMPSHRAQGRF